MPLQNAAPVQTAAVPHLHIAAETCPICDQEIPSDRRDEVNGRLLARETARSAEVTKRLHDQFERDKTEMLERERVQAATQLSVARLEERQAADAAAQLRISAADASRLAVQGRLDQALDRVRAVENDAEAHKVALETELATTRQQHAQAMEQLAADAAANEAAIRTSVKQEADATVAERLAEAQHARQEAEASLLARIERSEESKLAAEEIGRTLQAQLDQVRADGTAAIEKMTNDFAAAEQRIRAEAATAAEAALSEKITSAEQAKADTDAKLAAAEQALLAERQQADATLASRLQEQREALELATTAAVNAEKANAFEEKTKLLTKVEELQRAIEKKNAEDLGEGAEVDLFEALKSEFGSDKIERIPKGQPGADIRHTVIHNGRECGTILYDSKNHGAWRNDFVTKLAADKLADKADHAILSTRKFPAGTRHLHQQDGVIIANPARVVALVQIIRDHVVQTNALRLSAEARTQKTAALYDFVTSARCTQLFEKIDEQMESLLDLQVKEKKAHDANWKRQGELIRTAQKVRADISNEIDIIIGTAGAEEVEQ